MKIKNKSKARKIVLSVLVGYIILVAVIYIFGVIYYKNHFYSGSVINGIDATGKTVEEVKQTLSDEIESYTLNITGRDEMEANIVATQIDMKYVEDGKVEELKEKQNPFTWFLSFKNDKTYTMAATTTYNKEALTAVIDGLSFFAEENVAAPENAHLEETDTGYEIAAEVMGTTLDKEKTVQLITDSIDAGETKISLEEEGCYIDPTVFSDNEDLITKRDQFNAYLGVTVTYDFSDRQEVVDKEVIKTFIAENEEGEISLSEEKIREYIQQLGYTYDTFGLSREFTTTGGSTITLKGGDYGWCINKSEETTALMEAIQNGESQTRTPIYLYSGICRDTNDIGGTYVEISISEQRMWLYKDGQQLVSTAIVTGDVSKGYDTPSGGVWAVDAKMQDTYLTGQGYSSPVTFWLPFNGNVGIHDATWRPEFGGSIYQTNGSHGCVNTPYDNAKIIFENIEIGYPIVVY